MIVDAHVHVTGAVCQEDKRGSASTLLAAMDAAGIDVSLVMGLLPDDNPSTLATGQVHRDRMISFMVPEIGPQTEAQVARAVAAKQIGGLGEIYVRCGSAQLPEAYLEPVLVSARKYQLPVMLHTGNFSYTAPIMMEGMIRQYPEVTFILGHMGSLAFVLDAIELAKRYPNVYLETSGMPSTAMLHRAVVECGPERLLFGSDYPYWHPEVEKARIQSAGLGPRVTQLVLGENAARLFSL